MLIAGRLSWRNSRLARVDLAGESQSKQAARKPVGAIQTIANILSIALLEKSKKFFRDSSNPLIAKAPPGVACRSCPDRPGGPTAKPVGLGRWHFGVGFVRALPDADPARLLAVALKPVALADGRRCTYERKEAAARLAVRALSGAGRIRIADRPRQDSVAVTQ
jgi:hypothetical protein